MSCSKIGNESISFPLFNDTKESLSGCSFYHNKTPELIEPINILIDKFDATSIRMVNFRDVATNFIPNAIYTSFPEVTALIVKNENSVAKLKELKPSFFTNATKLTYLYIIYNSIPKLNADSFGDAVNLEYVDLQENEIEFVHKNTFSKVGKLRCVDLHNNKIKQIQIGAFTSESLPVLYANDLYNNVCINDTFTKKNNTLKNLKMEVASHCNPKEKKPVKLTELNDDKNKQGMEDMQKEYLQMKLENVKLQKEISILKKLPINCTKIIDDIKKVEEKPNLQIQIEACSKEKNVLKQQMEDQRKNNSRNTEMFEELSKQLSEVKKQLQVSEKMNKKLENDLKLCNSGDEKKVEDPNIQNQLNVCEKEKNRLKLLKNCTKTNSKNLKNGDDVTMIKKENANLKDLLKSCNIKDQKIFDKLKCFPDTLKRKTVCEKQTCWVKKNLKSCSARNLLYKKKMVKYRKQIKKLEKELYLLKKRCNKRDGTKNTDDSKADPAQNKNLKRMKDQIKVLKRKLAASQKKDNSEEQIIRKFE